MQKIAVGMLNKDVQFVEGEQLALFYNEEEAYATISRSLRDSYIRGEVTEDWLKSHKFIQVGVFDTITYKFIHDDDLDDLIVSFELDCWQAVKDLKEEKENA